MKTLKFIGAIFFSVAVGFICGLLGGGGGMLCVPLLIYFFDVKNKKAHATAIFIMLLTSIVSGVFYILSGFYKFSQGLYVAIGAIVGGIVGAFLLKKLSSNVVQIIFNILMIVAGIKLLI